jgi:hypothetical protein
VRVGVFSLAPGEIRLGTIVPVADEGLAVHDLVDAVETLPEPGHQILSDHGFQPLAVQQIEQLERRPARMLLADLPLSNCRHAGVEN